LTFKDKTPLLFILISILVGGIAFWVISSMTSKNIASSPSSSSTIVTVAPEEMSDNNTSTDMSTAAAINTLSSNNCTNTSDSKNATTASNITGKYYAYSIPAQGTGHLPNLNDSDLAIQRVYKDKCLEYPTSMAFLGPSDILVLEKDRGTIKRIVNGSLLPEPVLDVNVATESERGMLGIALAKNVNQTSGQTHQYAFVYFTESGGGKDGDDLKGVKPLGNRLYRYEFVGGKLVNPKLLLDLPADPVARHNGGKVLIGPDENIYLVIGDKDHRTKIENNQTGAEPDGTGVIYRITMNGSAIVSDNKTLGSTEPLNKYYAYGIRNSFGMDFDPITGKLWDTENGPEYGDEINLVEPHFNSGWADIMGMYSLEGHYQDGLVSFGGVGKYSDPEFEWLATIGVTDIKFLNSDKLGSEYKNDMFVGDISGNIYHFDLDESRTALSFPSNSSLADKVVSSKIERSEPIFASGFDAITDLEVGPDGCLYVLTFAEKGGIFRVTQSSVNTLPHI
jgi:aldose sugar dehydrogenase